MRWPVVGFLFWLAVSAAARGAYTDLDESGTWQASGPLPTQVSRVAAPPPQEGASALQVRVEEGTKGYGYVTLLLKSADLREHRRLRFRLFGGLSSAELIEVMLQDDSRRIRKWSSDALRERSRKAEWTEFRISLDSPTQDGGVDLARVSRIIWRVYCRGGGQSASFFLDGVTLEPASSAKEPPVEEVSLEGAGWKAFFSRATRFELVRLQDSHGRILPVATFTRMKPLEPSQPLNDVVNVGAPLVWREFDASGGQLRVSYEEGDYQIESRFSWDGDRLAIRKRIVALREGRGVPWSSQGVTFGDAFDRYMIPRGQGTEEGPLPTDRFRECTSNWVAALSPEGGVVIMFPMRPLYAYRLDKRDVIAYDRYVFGHENVIAGMWQDYDAWIAPVADARNLAEMAPAKTRDLALALRSHADESGHFFSGEFAVSAPRGAKLLANDSLIVWEASNNFTVPESAAPPEEDAPRVTLSLARGETEPVHLVVTPRRTLGRLSARPGDLVSAQGDIIPASQIRVRYSAYVRIRKTTPDEQRGRNDILRYLCVGVIDRGGDFLLTDRFWGGDESLLGTYEDVLFDDPPPNVQVGSNQPLWVTVSVDENAKPGVYQGALNVFEDGAQIAIVPLTVTVWPFALPRLSSLPTWYQLWVTEPVMRSWKDYYRNLADHKVSGFGGWPVKVIEGDGVLDVGPSLRWDGQQCHVGWENFDRVATVLLDDLGFRHCKFPYAQRGAGHANVWDFAGLKESTPEFGKAFEDYLVEARRHFSERGWLDRMLCYVFDEPDQERLAVVRRAASAIRSLVPETRVFTSTSLNTDRLVGVVNMWCAVMAFYGRPTTDFRSDLVAEGRQRGETFWVYNHSNDCIGAPVVSHRLRHWSLWKERLDGYFHWSVNYWGTDADPWSTRYRIGSANFILPGKKGPVDTVRWEMVREGLEDYDYLKLLEAQVQRGGIPSQLVRRAEEALARARRLVPDTEFLEGVDPAEVSALRNEIGGLLAEMASALDGR